MSQTRQIVIDTCGSFRNWLADNYVIDNDTSKEEALGELQKRKKLLDSITEFREYLKKQQDKHYLDYMRDNIADINTTEDFMNALDMYC